MSQNQKENQVVTNNKGGQHNQSNPSNQDYQKKSGDASKMPNVNQEDKNQPQVPNKHNVDEKDRFRKTPVAGQEQEEDEQEIDNDDDQNQEEFATPSENEKRSKTKDVE